MKALAPLLLLLASLVFPAMASGQPSGLTTCLSVAPATCEEANGPDFLLLPCGRLFSTFYGRIAWFPLRYVGPITIELEATAISAIRFPVYLEIVPLPGIAGGPCGNSPGEVVAVSNGGSPRCGSIETIGPLDLAHGDLLEIGSPYAIRLHFFGQPRRAQESVAIDCIRVTADSVTAVESRSWGNLKSLFR